MVLLTVTPAIVEGLQTLKDAVPLETWTQRLQSQQDEPSLDDATVGSPVSHSQVVDIWRALQDASHGEYTLEKLLKGSKIYVPPPTPKPEPSAEYKALMARLRRDQQQLEYERMANPLPTMETFSQRFPNSSSMAQAFAAVNRPSREEDIGDDDITFNDVHRQLMLILNFVASILGVAATLWVLARWWSTPARLFLTMGGSIVVGIAEVAMYSGYVWHLSQAKKQDKTLKEVKEIVQTWTVGASDENILVDEMPRAKDEGLRRRHKEIGPKQ